MKKKLLLLYFSNGLRSCCTLLFLSLFTLAAHAQDRVLKVSGRVTDELDNPVAGANVSIVGTGIGTLTNAKGNYSISVSPTDSLEFSFVSYKKVRYAIRNRVDLNVKLEAADGGLNEVRVVGYGQQKKISVIGAQSTLDAKDLKLPIRDIASSLGGR
ncbi:MAG TPA: carboxypeptidase-like regulatory domain-containing protein, partial [Chitinophagaceae bacterium]|nr:carboxypeptidase-like regulatory domain-containing protein [Chitinophagaceae bacterium]